MPVANMVKQRVVVSVAWNVSGAVLPLVFGLATIPLLIEYYGTERFGMLGMVWVLIGYFGLFDLGIGRALTKLLSEKIASNNLDGVPDLVATALYLLRWMGVVSGVMLLCIAPWAADWIKATKEVETEVFFVMLILAVTTPFVVSYSGWRGVLEAYGRFDLVNLVKLPLGIAAFIAPLAVIPLSNTLWAGALTLSFTRVIGWWVTRKLCIRLLPRISNAGIFRRDICFDFLRFGGWMTVSSIIGPLMVYADRFLIAGFLSVGVVAYYVTPYEVVTKILLFSLAFSGVLFQVFASRIASELAYAQSIFIESMKVVLLGVAPVIAVIFVFSYEGIALWLGEDFASRGYLVAQILILGVWLSGVGQVSVSALYGAGRSDWVAKLHFFELPMYFIFLYFMIKSYGVIGVAMAWTFRVAFDSFVLMLMAQVVLKIRVNVLPNLIFKPTVFFLAFLVFSLWCNFYLKLFIVLLIFIFSVSVLPSCLRRLMLKPLV